MRRVALSIVMGIAAATAAAQEEFSRYLREETARDLASQGTIVRILRADEAPALAPSVGARGDLAREVEEFHATVAVEILRLFQGQPRVEDPSRRMSALLNTMASVSAMKGITYWSVTRNKTWILFAESYAIAGPENPTRIPDPVFGGSVEMANIYSYQEDTTFGKNVYQTVLVRGADSIWAKTENLGAIKYLFVPVIPEHSLVTHTVLIPLRNGLLYYGVALLRTSFPMGDPDSRAESLKNRIIAMSDWLWGQFH